MFQQRSETADMSRERPLLQFSRLPGGQGVEMPGLKLYNV